MTRRSSLGTLGVHDGDRRQADHASHDRADERSLCRGPPSPSLTNTPIADAPTSDERGLRRGHLRRSRSRRRLPIGEAERVRSSLCVRHAPGVPAVEHEHGWVLVPSTIDTPDAAG